MSFNVKDLIVGGLEMGVDDGGGGCPAPTWPATECTTLGLSRAEAAGSAKGLSSLRQQLRKTLSR